MTQPPELNPQHEGDTHAYEEYEGPTIPFDLFGKALELRRNNTGLMRYEVDDGEFDHVLHARQTPDGELRMYFFLKELHPDIKDLLIVALEELNFDIIQHEELDRSEERR
jgi:hypothetical protein